MVFDAATALIWILFLALFPMAYFWLRRAWRIFIQRDYSDVALKRGVPPENPKKWAPITGMLNLTAGLIALWIIVGVPLFIATGIRIGPFHQFDAWSAMAGSTIWIKIFADFIVSRQAHPYQWGRKKKS
ncbi:hypothetical protein [Geoalkalibacter sp.]|uniref:hypothetical protein n=1 Tax=Geoalkalibacter sp. TaxID=3041440 RepID=UPI00272DF2CA|nr:hypothetical protein [Geoalkalibacter sp.]